MPAPDTARLRIGVGLLLALAFAGRLAYGLASPFWTEDERQVYLVGLRSFARGEWPYFGTEVAVDVAGLAQQLPGALQGWLVRLPLEIWPAPESPFVLLNLLSFAALSLLAWYSARRAPGTPGWLIWGALLSLPWTLNFSTHIVNTSYILPAAILFFAGFLEGTPSFRRGIVSRGWAWGMMGAGLLAMVQIHMSWVLLPPYLAFAAADLWRRDRRAIAGCAAAWLAGALTTGSLLAPTVVRYGLASGDTGGMVGFYPAHLSEAGSILARILSFTAFETNRFLGLTTAERVLLLGRQPWVLPCAAFVTLLGFAQPIAMAVSWFRRGVPSRDWTRVRWLMAASVIWVALAFAFSARRPRAHTFYVMLPVAFVYAAHWWERIASPRWNRLAATALVSGVLMHAGIAIDRASRLSLYLDRPLVAAAIEERNDRWLGDRRDSLQAIQDRRPRPIDQVPDADAYLRADPAVDLVAADVRWRPLLGGRVSTFALTLENRSGTAAYIDLRYASRYLRANGDAIDTREGVIKEILQPGERRHWPDLADGMAPEGAVSAELVMRAAEKVIPRSAVNRPLPAQRELERAAAVVARGEGGIAGVLLRDGPGGEGADERRPATRPVGPRGIEKSAGGVAGHGRGILRDVD